MLKFSGAMYKDKDTKGIITPDSNGYYDMMLGALNCYNSAGEYYTAKEVIELFQASSILMRKIQRGALYSELGHPKKIPGMKEAEFYARVNSVYEINMCAHISEITLDTEFGKKHPEYNNPDLISIVGKVKPYGPHAGVVQAALDNPKQNSAFSIRGLTENKFRNGRVERKLISVITFDFVTEPGIPIADKFMSPGLESVGSNAGILNVEDVTLDVESLIKVIKSKDSLISTEEYREANADLIRRLESRPSRLSEW